MNDNGENHFSDHHYLSPAEAKDLRDIKVLLQGDLSTGKGGLIHVVQRIGETMYGTPDQPGGVVGVVDKLKKFMWMFAGGMVVIQVILQVVLKLTLK